MVCPSSSWLCNSRCVIFGLYLVQSYIRMYAFLPTLEYSCPEYLLANRPEASRLQKFIGFGHIWVGIPIPHNGQGNQLWNCNRLRITTGY